MAGKSISRTAVWILLLLLILGLGGFGVTNLSGTIRSLGSVGDTDIEVTEYARALQSEIRALEAERGAPVSFAEASTAGIDRIVLSRLVAEAALTDETARLGISIGDANLREQIIDIPGFRGLDGTFDRTAYQFALDQAGLNESVFEENVRAEASRTLLTGAVVSGINAPAAYTDTLLTYIAERRDISFAVLDRSDLTTGAPVPEEADLQAYYDAHPDLFTAPEIRRITYMWLTPEMLLDTVEVEETALRDAFEARKAEFSQPERRLVERLVFPDTASAEAAQAGITDGTTSFEQAVAARGLALADVDLGDVAHDDLGPAGDPVFAAETGDVVGPVETDLGPALFRINAVLQAQETSYEDALPDLRAELAGDRARRVIDSRMDAVDDLLVGGATIEDVVKETDMQPGQIDWHPGMVEGIGAYEAFREAAAAAAVGDFPEVSALDDGGIFALRLDEVVPPTLRPLDEVREELTRRWSADALVAALRDDVAPKVEQLKSGAAFDALGIEAQQVTDLTRRGFQPGAPRDFIDRVFAMSPGDVELLDGDARLFVLRLDAVKPPATDDPDLDQLRRSLQEQATSDMVQDLFQALADDIRTRAGITLDQQAINAVHANFR